MRRHLKCKCNENESCHSPTLQVVSWFSNASTTGGSRTNMRSASSRGLAGPPPQELFTDLVEAMGSEAQTVSDASASNISLGGSFVASGGGGGTAATTTAPLVPPGPVRGARPSMLGGGSSGKGGGRTVDPILEEVRNAEFSLKIMVAAGCGCAFHVGGSVDSAAADSSQPGVPHWEYFVGDR